MVPVFFLDSFNLKNKNAWDILKHRKIKHFTKSKEQRTGSNKKQLLKAASLKRSNSDNQVAFSLNG